MEPLLVKIFGAALALSQVTTASDAVQTRFDRTQDQPRVIQLLQARAPEQAGADAVLLVWLGLATRWRLRDSRSPNSGYSLMVAIDQSVRIRSAASGEARTFEPPSVQLCAYSMGGFSWACSKTSSAAC
jgi:hypothetical protein